MNSWYNLQGFLSYRPSGALGRLKAKKHLWLVFDEQNCQLLFYKNESDVGSKSIQGSIDLHSAAVSLNMDDPNQFIIHSQGKEHTFTAETHESTMIWLLTLQAKRDNYNNHLAMMIEQGTADLKKNDDFKRKESLPSDVEIQQMINKVKSAENVLHSEENVEELLKSKSFKEIRASPVPYFSNRFRDNIFRTANVIQHRKSVDLGAVNSSINSTRASPVIHRLRNCSGGSVITTDSDDTDTSIGCRSALQSSHNPASVDGSFSSDNPEISISCTPLWLAEQSRSNLLTFSQPNIDGSSSHINASLQHCMNSNGKGSIPSGTLTLTDRLKELEVDLLTSKLEIAKAMNREASLKDELEVKESVIHQLQSQLKDSNEKYKNMDDDTLNISYQKMHEKCRILQNQNRYLNEEVLKLARIWQQEQMKYMQQNLKSCDLEVELHQLKRDYVFVLQSSIRVGGGDGPELIEIPVYGGLRNRSRISKLLEEARKLNPCLPSLEGMAKLGCHVDSYGFKHCYVDEALMLHYLCGQLHHHYISNLSTFEYYQKRWNEILTHSETVLPRTKEVKTLVRNGIPNNLRAEVWSLIIHDKVKTIKGTKGPLYFDHLRSLVSESEAVLGHRRQISLDLLRTMPNNVHFNDIEADGVKKMQDVLQAFCLHNPNVGYCQGMNFIVGMALLFMKAEDAFWFLIAITERYFPPYYFDQNLLGAQADQEVLKDVLTIKLPALAKHFNSLEIELSTVTLNWFLALFFDSVPFESLLRIWDCFLYEGPKVLFRFSMAILKMNETCLLQKSNTISIMRQLKASCKFCFDIDGLIKTAFEDIKPFPRRAEIVTKQTCFLKTLKEKLRKRNLEIEALENKEKIFENPENSSSDFSVECCAIDDNNIWLCEGQQQRGRIIKVDFAEETKEWLDIQLDSRIMCIHVMKDINIMFLGALAHCLFLYNIVSRKVTNRIQLNDSVLSICSYEDIFKKRLYLALADGTIGVLEWQVSEATPDFDQLDVFYVMLTSSAVTYLKLIEKRLWCASGNRIVILHATTLDIIDQFTVSANSLDTIASINESKHGVWILLRGSASFQLWDPQNLVCRLAFNTNSCVSYNQLDHLSTALRRLTSIVALEKSVWVGTSDGYILIYEIQLIPSRKTSAFNSPGNCTTSNSLNMDLVNETIQELCRYQSDYVDDRLKHMRGRSDSGYQTVGDASKENTSVSTNDNDKTINNNKIDVFGNGTNLSNLPILELAPKVCDAAEYCVGNSKYVRAKVNDYESNDQEKFHLLKSDQSEDKQLNQNFKKGSPFCLSCDKEYFTNVSNNQFEEFNKPSYKSQQINICRQVGRRQKRSRYPVAVINFNTLNTLKGRSCSISDVETSSTSHRYKVLDKDLDKTTCYSFEEISHLFGGSGESALSSPMWDSFDFDDVFISYTEDDKKLVSEKFKSTLALQMQSNDSKTSKGKVRILNDEYFLSETSDFTSAGNEYSSSGVDESILKKVRKTAAIYKTKDLNSRLKVCNNRFQMEKSETALKLSKRDNSTTRKSSVSSLEEISMNVEYDSVQESKSTSNHLCIGREISSNDLRYFKESDSGSFISLNETDIPYSVDLVLKERIKISDKAIKCLIAVEEKNRPTVIYSCSEKSHEPDAIIKWAFIHNNGASVKDMWEQKSIIDASHRRSSMPSYAHSSSVITNEDFSLNVRSKSIVNVTSSFVGNGIAKVQNALSNFSTVS